MLHELEVRLYQWFESHDLETTDGVCIVVGIIIGQIIFCTGKFLLGL